MAWRPKPKSSRRSQRTPGPAVRATGTTRPDRSCGCWLGLGDWGMREIFHFALMRRRVRHSALTMRLRSRVRSAVKTASWRAFAAVDTFGLVWLLSGHDTTHAIAAAGAVVGVEAITKSFLYFAHGRLWEAPLLRLATMGHRSLRKSAPAKPSRGAVALPAGASGDASRQRDLRAACASNSGGSREAPQVHHSPCSKRWRAC